MVARTQPEHEAPLQSFIEERRASIETAIAEIAGSMEQIKQASANAGALLTLSATVRLLIEETLQQVRDALPGEQPAIAPSLGIGPSEDPNSL